MAYSIAKKILSMGLILSMFIGLLPGIWAEEYAETLYEEVPYESPLQNNLTYETPDSNLLLEESNEEEAITKFDTRIPVRFFIEPAEAIVYVYDPVKLDEFGNWLEYVPEEDGTFLLYPGEYLVDVFCDGYEPFIEVPLTVDDQALDLPAVMKPAVETDNTEEAPVDGDLPMAEDALAGEGELNNEEEPPDEDVPVDEEVPADGDLPMAEDVLAGEGELNNEKEPASGVASVDEEVPDDGDLPMAEDALAGEEEPTEGEEPASEAAPVDEEVPDDGDLPMAEDALAGEDELTEGEEPPDEDAPIDEKVPDDGDLPMAEDALAGEDEPTEGGEEPASEVAPVKEEASDDRGLPVDEDVPTDGKKASDAEEFSSEQKTSFLSESEAKEEAVHVFFTYSIEESGNKVNTIDGGKISVSQGETGFTPEEDGSFLLMPGEYSYQFHDDSGTYEELEGQFTVEKVEKLEIPLTLKETVIYTTASSIFINPIYEDVISEEDIPEPSISEEELLKSVIDENRNAKAADGVGYRTAFLSTASGVYSTPAEAGPEVKRQLLLRESTITFRAVSPEPITGKTEEERKAEGDRLLGIITAQAYNAALVHTGTPTEGDYIRFEFGGYDATGSFETQGSKTICTAVMTPLYYTSSAQENAVGSEVSRILGSLNLAGKSQYQKAYAIYNYLTNTVRYDNDNLNNAKYTLKYTAYAALIQHKAVCQGYATALYRLLLEAGVDTRIVSSNAIKHAWNIIEMDNLYYEADATWDEGKTSYTFFLRGTTSWDSIHKYNGKKSGNGDQYSNGTFASGTYPLSSSDYVSPTAPAITGHPASVTVNTGNTAVFKVTASGATSYQWQYKNGSTWVNSNMAGSKTAELTVTVQATHNGMQLRCAVSNSNGTAYSNTATLTVELSAEAKEFINNCYRCILGREGDESGINSWVSFMEAGNGCANVVFGFMHSQEFKKRMLSNEEVIVILYNVMLDREPDESGKAMWLTYLNNGVSYDYIIHAFAGSAEFNNLCAEKNLSAGTITLTENRDQNVLVTAYVQRCYQQILGRFGDIGGLNNWTGQLLYKGSGAGSIVNSFITSKEFKNKGLNDSAIVEILYHAMLNREPDPSGMESWLSYLNDGMSPSYVAAGFVRSNEFKGVCAEYGIDPGTITLTENRDKNAQVTRFVSRNYRSALNRKGDIDGLNNWTGHLLRKEMTPQQVAYGFVFSNECVNRKLNDRAFVQMLYRLYLGREPDTEGFNNWLNRLSGGMTRQQCADSFGNSAEFAGIAKSYGL